MEYSSPSASVTSVMATSALWSRPNVSASEQSAPVLQASVPPPHLIDAPSPSHLTPSGSVRFSLITCSLLPTSSMQQSSAEGLLNPSSSSGDYSGIFPEVLSFELPVQLKMYVPSSLPEKFSIKKESCDRFFKDEHLYFPADAFRCFGDLSFWEEISFSC